MKIVFTAEHAGDLAPSTSWASCWWRGGRWANLKLSAGQLIELAHDAEVLVTSYDE